MGSVPLDRLEKCRPYRNQHKKTATAFSSNYGLFGPMCLLVFHGSAETQGTLRSVHSALSSFGPKTETLVT